MNRRGDPRRAALALEIVSLAMVISVGALLAWVAFGDRPTAVVVDDLGPGLAALALVFVVPLAVCGVAGLVRWWRAETDTPLIGYGIFAILMVAWQIPSPARWAWMR